MRKSCLSQTNFHWKNKFLVVSSWWKKYTICTSVSTVFYKGLWWELLLYENAMQFFLSLAVSSFYFFINWHLWLDKLSIHGAHWVGNIESCIKKHKFWLRLEVAGIRFCLNQITCITLPISFKPNDCESAINFYYMTP
jgi:hypothetical protein